MHKKQCCKLSNFTKNKYYIDKYIKRYYNIEKRRENN